MSVNLQTPTPMIYRYLMAPRAVPSSVDHNFVHHNNSTFPTFHPLFSLGFAVINNSFIHFSRSTVEQGEREMKTSTNRKLNHFFCYYGTKKKFMQIIDSRRRLSCVSLAPTLGSFTWRDQKKHSNGNFGSRFAVFWTLNFNEIIIIYTRSASVEWGRSGRRKVLFRQSPQIFIASSSTEEEKLCAEFPLQNFDCFFIDRLGCARRWLRRKLSRLR